MTTLTAPTPAAAFETVEDLLHQLGDVPASRVRLWPMPGSATEQDLLDQLDHRDRACELIDGTLVEKPVGLKESILATILIRILGAFVHERRLGVLSGESGPYRLRLGVVRLPDIAFIAWNRIPGRVVDLPPVAQIAPNLAIEILSPSNTPSEMKLKLREYFAAGVELAWLVDPPVRTIAVYTRPDGIDVLLREGDVLDGGTTLPGFRLPVADLFEEFGRLIEGPHGPPAADGHRE